MDTKTFYTLLVTALLALFGAAAKYLTDLRLARRKDRLDRVNQQLGKLYGPLYALDRAGSTAWTSFRSVYRPGVPYFKPPVSKEELSAWRLWMKEVFMPLNLRMEATILENAHLIIEGEIPECFLDLASHIAAYKAVIKRWENGDYSEHLSIIEHPSKPLTHYITNSYFRLINEQKELIQKVQ